MNRDPEERCAGCGQRHIEHSWRDGVFWCDGASCFTPITVRAQSMPAAALRQSPSVEEVARVIDEGAFAGEGDLTWTARRGRRTKALAKAQAIAALYGRGG